jgi:hypothetical protein
MWPIVAFTAATGYFFNKDKTDRELRDPIVPIDRITKNEKSNGDNIYQSTQFDEVNREVLEKSVANYKAAETPSETFMIPPYFNTYGAVGNKNLESLDVLSSEQLSKVEDIKRYSNILQKDTPKIDNRPMFTEQEYLTTDLPEVNVEKFESETSLLTGLPMDKKHNNMIPFFGSNVKQNVETFSNESLLDKYSGNTHAFQHKKEIKSLYDLKEQNLWQSNVYYKCGY